MFCTTIGYSQSWEQWKFLMGTWAGEGSGNPGQGTGTFTFAFDLNQNILVRKSHTEFPASGQRPAFSHDDLLIVFQEPKNVSQKAICFDNEGHILHYSVSFSGESVVLISEKTEGMPVFRLTYTPLDSLTVNTKFEMSQDGTQFIKYLEGKSTRSK